MLRASAGDIAPGPRTADAATLKDPPRIGKRLGLRKRRLQPARAEPRELGTLGRFPVVAVIVGLGLVLCAVTDDLSRATLTPSIWLLWAGVSVIVAPIVYRLCAADVPVGERIALVCLLGLSLYAVKVMRDPFSYTMPDEFFHAYNAQEIVRHHQLFTANPILPVSARYPGLEGATSALMTLTGMSSFGSGLIVIAAARLTLTLAMLALFYCLCGSWRIASLGAAFYAGNSNFLLWSAQFSYESLSLPLLVVVLGLIVQRAAGDKPDRHMWSIPTVIVIAAIVITHHLTSYLLDVILIVLVLVPRVSRGRLNNLRVGRFTVVSLVLTIGWLVVVASETVGYISPLVTNAFNEALKTIGGESAPRAPFASSSGVVPTPLLEKAIAFGALVLLFAALPFGLRAVWRRHKQDPVAVGFCLIALGYFAILVLRLEPDAWEIGNRLGEFLFIGLGFVVAYGVVDRLLSRSTHPLVRGAVAVAACVVVVGGAITGWPPDNIPASPVTIRAGGRQINSETLAVGKWVGTHTALSGFGAGAADGRTILLYGNAYVLTAPSADLQDILPRTTITSGQLALMRAHNIRYIVVDTRMRSDDDSRGYRFSLRPPGGPRDQLRSKKVVTRFDKLPRARIYDSGHVYIYALDSGQ